MFLVLLCQECICICIIESRRAEYLIKGTLVVLILYTSESVGITTHFKQIADRLSRQLIINHKFAMTSITFFQPIKRYSACMWEDACPHIRVYVACGRSRAGELRTVTAAAVSRQQKGDDQGTAGIAASGGQFLLCLVLSSLTYKMACIVPSSPLSLPVVRTTHQRRTVAILLVRVCACVLSLSIVFPGDICKTNQSEHQDLWKVVMFVDHLTLQKAPCMFISFSCPSNAERQTVSSFRDKACKTETSPGFCLRLHVCQLAPSACLTTSLSDS